MTSSRVLSAAVVLLWTHLLFASSAKTYADSIPDTEYDFAIRK